MTQSAADTDQIDSEPQSPDAEPEVPRPSLPVHVPVDEHSEKARLNNWYYVDLDNPDYVISNEVLALMEARTARNLNVIPVLVKNKTVSLAVENPDDVVLAQSLRPQFAGMTMRLVYADPQAIRRKIEKVYSASVEAARLAKRRDDSQEFRGVSSGGDMGRIESSSEGNNVQLLRLIVEQALRDEASDIHIEPIEDAVKIRYRVHGKLRVAGVYPASRADGLITLIKVEAQMRTDNHLVPDSGVLVFKQQGQKDVDVRVETAPTAWGTSAVMRLQADIWRDLATLGFSPENERRFRLAIAQPYGVVLLTGPTGSGKTTTLYSALRERISEEDKIVTMENPIEFKAPDGLSQMSINDAQGMTFFSGLRSGLRQDPDIMLLGEIRDRETAETAIDAAMTGHLLLSTLHTNDAPGAIPRMTRMGIEPFLLSSSLRCVVAQRLVRQLCAGCRVAVTPNAAEIEAWGFPVDNLPEVLFTHSDLGCHDCHGTGFSGRLPIHEVMLVGGELRHLVAEGASQRDIEAAAREGGMTSMREDGFAKAMLGLTSLAEINMNTLRDLA